MPRPLRGHYIDLAVTQDATQLAAELENLGFARNAFLDHVAKTAINIAQEEEQRLSTTLASKKAPLDLVVCKYYGETSGKKSWLSMRKRDDQWYLSAILFDEA
jgi:hypothetical protein